MYILAQNLLIFKPVLIMPVYVHELGVIVAVKAY